jgi:hypothetical protein
MNTKSSQASRASRRRAAERNAEIDTLQAQTPVVAGKIYPTVTPDEIEQSLRAQGFRPVEDPWR